MKKNYFLRSNFRAKNAWQLFFILFLLLCLSFPALAANWYVSQYGAGKKDGTSVENAWQATNTETTAPLCKGIGCINWDNMGAGDTLYIIGTLHNITTFPVLTSGSRDNYFTISGYDAKSGIVLGAEKTYNLWSGPDAYGAFSISYTPTVVGAIEWMTEDGPLTNTKLINAGKIPDRTWVEGSYYKDTGTNTVYWKPVGGSISGKTVTFDATLSIDISNIDWVKVVRLKHYLTKYSIGQTAPASHIWLDNLKIQNIASIAIQVNFTRKTLGSDYGKITNCTISDAQNGIYFLSAGNEYNNDYWLISRNIITNIHTSPDSHGIGIQCGSNNIIEHNDISYTNTGITMWCGKKTVMNNNIIRYNHIYNSETARGDGRAQGIGWEGTNTTSTSMTGNYIYYNIIHDCGGAGIRPKFIDSANYVYNNTVRNCNPNFYFQGVSAYYPIGGVIKNNLSVDPNGNHWFISTYNNGDYSAVTINNNLYYPDTETRFSFKGKSYNFANWKKQLVTGSVNEYDGRSISSNPLLSNLSGRYSLATDFKPMPGSPAIDRGSNSVWFGKQKIFDVTGSTPITSDSGTIVAPGGTVDIGAYDEAGPAPSPPNNLKVILGK